MKSFIFAITLNLLLAVVGSTLVRADIAIVVNAESEIDELSERQVRDLFMGRYSAFPNGAAALPIDQPVRSELRQRFYRTLTGKTVSQINAYWAKLIFSGRASPPRIARSAEAVAEMVAQNKSTIAYMPVDSVQQSARVVFIIKDPQASAGSVSSK